MWKKVLLGASICGGLLIITACSGCFILFTRLRDGYEVRDNQVYYRTFDNTNLKVTRTAVAGANPETLKAIRGSGGRYASDGVKVFCRSALIAQADPSTFQVMDWRNSYSRDDKTVFYGTFAISQDVANFEILSHSYARDSQAVYFGSKAIPGADPATFQITDAASGRAQDKNYEYNLGKRIESEPLEN